MMMVAALALVASAAAAEGPCDILGAAGNPCVAAHSTVRALFAKYDGPLYNVSRPDGTSKNIGLLSPGGFADKKSHDEFCSKMDCVISNVFDQSHCGGQCAAPGGNHLGQRHKLINASRHSITVGKAKTPVYGMWFDPGFGMHVDNTTGIATGNDPETIYAVSRRPIAGIWVAIFSRWQRLTGHERQELQRRLLLRRSIPSPPPPFPIRNRCLQRDPLICPRPPPVWELRE